MSHSFMADFRHRFEQCLRAEIRAIPLDACIDHSGVTIPRSLIGPMIRACATSLAYATRRRRGLTHEHVFLFAYPVAHSLRHLRR